MKKKIWTALWAILLVSLLFSLTMLDYVYYPIYAEYAPSQKAFFQKLRDEGPRSIVRATKIYSEPWEYVCVVRGYEYSQKEVRSVLVVTDLMKGTNYNKLTISPGDFGFRKFDGLMFYDPQNNYVKVYLFPKEYINASGYVSYDKTLSPDVKAQFNRKNSCRKRNEALFDIESIGVDDFFVKIKLLPHN